MAILFALLASLFIGVNAIVITKCLERASAFTVATLLTAVGTVVCALLAAATLPGGAVLASWRAGLYFTAAGVFAPGLLRWLYFISLERVGPAASTSAIATIPAFAAVIAVLVLGERPSPPLAAGVGMVVGGIVVLQGTGRGRVGGRVLRARDLAPALVAALLGAVAINLRKAGLDLVDLPILGAAIGFATALLMYLLVLVASPRRRRSFTLRRADLPLFGAGGLSLALGWLCMFYALANGPVVLVAPLSSLYPLVVLVLSGLMLKGAEHITPRTVVGSSVVVAGVVLISVLRG